MYQDNYYSWSCFYEYDKIKRKKENCLIIETEKMIFQFVSISFALNIKKKIAKKLW